MFFNWVPLVHVFFQNILCREHFRANSACMLNDRYSASCRKGGTSKSLPVECILRLCFSKPSANLYFFLHKLHLNSFLEGTCTPVIAPLFNSEFIFLPICKPCILAGSGVADTSTFISHPSARFGTVHGSSCFITGYWVLWVQVKQVCF